MIDSSSQPRERDQRFRILVRHVEGAPVVTVRVAITGGARAEDIPGQALITGRLLAEGTRQRSWKQIAHESEERGMSLGASGGFECHGLSVDALASDWWRALEWAAEMTFEPAFPEDRHAWLCRQAAAELESLADQPEVRTSWGFLEQIYGTHPLARRLQGDADSLRRLTPEDCRAFHQRALDAGITLVVAGNVDEDEVGQAAEVVFERGWKWRRRFPDPPAPAASGPGRCEVGIEAADQSHLFLGHLTVPRNHPDVAALEILAVILGAGAGLVGRIPRRIREQEGLAYVSQANTVSGAGLDPGRLVVYVGTAPATAARAEAAAREELARVAEAGVTEAELEEARSYLLGREPFRRETARQWAEILLEGDLYGIPSQNLEWRRQELRAVDRERLESVARRHIRPGELVVTTGLPTSKTAPGRCPNPEFREEPSSTG